MAFLRSGCCAVALLLGVMPGRAEEPSPADKPPVSDPAKPPAPPQDAQPPARTAPKPVAAPAGSTAAVVVDATAFQAIVGRSVKSPTGEDMGRIVDVLVARNAQVRAAIIDFGGFLGVGSRKIAVDWSALNFSDVSKSGNVLVNLTANQVRMAPEFKQGDPIVVLDAGKPAEKATASAPKATDIKPAEAKPTSGASTTDATKNDASPSQSVPTGDTNPNDKK